MPDSPDLAYCCTVELFHSYSRNSSTQGKQIFVPVTLSSFDSLLLKGYLCLGERYTFLRSWSTVLPPFRGHPNQSNFAWPWRLSALSMIYEVVPVCKMYPLHPILWLPAMLCTCGKSTYSIAKSYVYHGGSTVLWYKNLSSMMNINLTIKLTLKL